VPFIVRWPGGGIEPQSTNEQLICLTDLFATVAEIVGVPVPAESCEDSVSFLPALRGKQIVSTRAGVIHHSSSGAFAYREGNWKMILASGSAGWTKPVRLAGGPKAQLYDLAVDAGEANNRYQSEAEVAKRLLAQFERDVKSGRSTKGPASKNDAPIVLWKESAGKKRKKKVK
jgi:arylsulfatase A-like enzyme